jgi:hypothetical protein
MNRTGHFIALILLFGFVFQNELIAQENTVHVPYKYENVKWPVDSLGNKGRNVIKWNLTPMLLWDSKNLNFSYERILRSHRSISVNLGFFRFPKFASANVDSVVNITSDSNRKGFSMAFDYRRYFAKRNVRWAPDGLYWGFWTSFHQSNFENDLSAMNESGDYINVKSKGKIGIYAIGAELGYQFLIGKHIVIDLIMVGPAIARYSFNVKLSADGQIEDTEVIEKVIDALIAKIPAFEELIDTGKVDGKGNLSVSSIGLRFMLQVGYLF